MYYMLEWCIKMTCVKDDVINQRPVAELYGGPDITRTMATGHLGTPHHWVLSVEHTYKHIKLKPYSWHLSAY